MFTISVNFWGWNELIVFKQEKINVVLYNLRHHLRAAVIQDGPISTTITFSSKVRVYYSYSLFIVYNLFNRCVKYSVFCFAFSFYYTSRASSTGLLPFSSKQFSRLYSKSQILMHFHVWCPFHQMTVVAQARP